jgi:3-hydroxyisobutyrate dehydrogenase-like beta-hydroxyacid dehydrogenase
MSTSAPPCAVVGRGRLGTALAAALRAGGVAVEGPLGRDEAPALSDRSMAGVDGAASAREAVVA